ncbi:MAG: 3-deoxy-manno-octulosonate cytidylyltransferase [Methylococcaceae bacterium]|jgi:3-deoxy-manno-octulosonate cytidylyltransferase (CMP-KDO synthetase)
MTQRFKVVIPARYASTRLPGKPLIDIAGKPMIAHVCERAKEAGADEIVVATDDERIMQVVNGLGIRALMTKSSHQSGTERIAEAARLCGWHEHDIIVNLQGDEPLIPPSYIEKVAAALAEQALANMATLAANIIDIEEIFNPNTVKVVLDKDDYALYFSRAPIPWERDSFTGGVSQPSGKLAHLRHIGIYAYRVGFLYRYCSWQASPLESVEALEQLRVLWHGERIRVKIVDQTPAAGVDTLADIRRVEPLLMQGL